jgi:hypothetical protein
METYGVFFVYTVGMEIFEEETIEITNEMINLWNPMIAMPCYDQLITEPTFMSMMKTAMMFKEIGLKFSIATTSDSLINRARNQLVAKFLANPEMTHIMFIDVDLGFSPEDILKLLWHDKEVVTGSYPIKDIRWDKVCEDAKKGVPSNELLGRSMRFVVNPVKDATNLNLTVDKGAIKIHDAGTGFMLIKRSAFMKLIEAYPELKYKDDTGALNEEERKWSYAFFNSYVDDESQRFLSEDYGFCRYWQKINGDVWVDPSFDLTHLGRLRYRATMMSYLEENAKFVES